jgi:hypothetical protein
MDGDAGTRAGAHRNLRRETDKAKARFAASSSSGWRRRAEIEVVLLLQSSDDSRHVDKPDLRRPHFRFDSVQLPCPTLRAAVRTNRYRLSVMQRGQLLQLGEQFVPPLILMRPVAVSRPP